MELEKSILILCAFLVCTECNHWVSIPGALTHITTSMNYYWGVNRANKIFICPRPCIGGKWRQIQGLLKQVDANDMEVWGVNKNNDIFRRSVTGAGGWIRVRGKLKHVSASGNGYIWGVNAADYIYRCKKPCAGAWINVPGRLAQIDGGEEYVFGVNSAGNAYFRPVDGSGRWTHIPGKLLKYITAGAGEIFGVGRATCKVYRCKLPCRGGRSWVQIDFCLKMNQLEATVAELAATAGSSIFKAKIDYIY